MSNQQIAFVFPGQGSQSLGMLGEFKEQAVVQQTFQEASEVLGYDLWQLIAEGPAEQLNETHRTQPALLAASIAMWRLWQTQSKHLPVYVAGHSLGEYSALVAANALDFKIAVKLVEKRGQLMQQAVPAGVGKMAAIIGVEDDVIKQACVQASQGEVVAPVNFNSPGQVVIAGNADGVTRAMEALKDGGARVLPLSVSVPSHCQLMQPAADAMRQELDNIEIRTPQISLINNVDVAIETAADAIKDALVRQLYNPVRWTETVELLAAKGINQVVECGPGNVLCGLIKRIDKTIDAHRVAKKAFFNQAVEALS
ncbi:ACP S-malonyltransferase [Aliikangiella maris]|uniref:Malonyl CoA-acyl carrier protein transacylase n=2 Tax=Aliikangiella maris TaxID=3162458 RepID=A0ABV2BUI3_9GAMM